MASGVQEAPRRQTVGGPAVDHPGLTLAIKGTLRVMKFGGTSIGYPTGLTQVLRLIRQASSSCDLVIVVSAAAGVTDALHRAVGHDTTAPYDNLGLIEDVYRRLCLVALSGTAAQEFETSLADTLDVVRCQVESGPLTAPEIADVVTTGERLSAQLVASALSCMGIPAAAADSRTLVRTGEAADGQTVDTTATYDQIRTWQTGYDRRCIPVVTGYAAADSSGRTTTLGRGGSDYTATLIAAALRASVVDRWTDVDGIYTEDPRRNGRATRLAMMHLQTAAGEARLGKTGIHPEALVPLIEAGIPMRVRSTVASAGGTLLTPGTDLDPQPASKWKVIPGLY